MAIVLKNLMETVVMEKIDELSGVIDCCTCDRCRMDLASYVLNRLEAKYVVTHEGELLVKLESLAKQHDTDIISLIIKATDIVRMNPNHNVKK